MTIGEQVWLARNLDATHFANGDPIPRITGEAAWAAAGASGAPAQSAYDNDETRVARDGLLYNYAAIQDPRGLCPQGFRVPTDADWAKLEATLGEDVAATRMKTRQYWPATENGPGNGTDDVGFGGLPAGFRTQAGDFFLGIDIMVTSMLVNFIFITPCYRNMPCWDLNTAMRWPTQMHSPSGKVSLETLPTARRR